MSSETTETTTPQVEESGPTLTIEVNDDDGNTAFSKKVLVKDVEFCITLKNLLDFIGDGSVGSDDIGVIPLSIGNVKKEEYLDLVVEYARFMRTPEFPKDERKEDAKIENELTQFEKDFVDKMSRETLTELILLSNFLDFKQLLEMLCCATAGLMKGKTAEQIRQEFNIKNDFSPEEEAKIEKENKFIEEAQERN